MRRIGFQIDEVIAFIAIAERRSFKAAAEALFISQPALSRRIEKLESAVGSQLFERTTRRVSLTQAGQQFLPHAQAALDELEMAVKGITETTAQRSGLVTVACVPTVAHHLVPTALKAFSERYPGVRVKIIDEGAGLVLESVVTGLADFGLNFIGAQEANIEFDAIYQENFVLAVPRNHRFASTRSLTWEDLADESFITMSGKSGNRILIDNAMSRVKKRPSISYEANHVAGALGLVTAGLGVAVVPGLALSGNAYPSLLGIPLAHPRISRTIGAIYRKGGRLHPLAMELLDMVKKTVASMKSTPS